MMKKLLVGLLCLLPLCGCAAETQWETVSDTIDDAVAVSSLGEQPYQISFSVPMDAVLETFSQTNTSTVYSHAEGDYEISALVMETTGIDEVIQELTGYVPEVVQTVQTERYGMPQYQFVWYSQSEDGGWLHQASVLTDVEYSYALVFSAREQTGTTYSDCRSEVMKSFGLYTYEGV